MLGGSVKLYMRDERVETEKDLQIKDVVSWTAYWALCTKVAESVSRYTQMQLSDVRLSKQKYSSSDWKLEPYLQILQINHNIMITELF